MDWSGCNLVFMSNFQSFVWRCVIIFVMVLWNWLKPGIWANWQCFFPSIRLDFQKNSWFGKLEIKSSILGQRLFLKHPSDFIVKKYPKKTLCLNIIILWISWNDRLWSFEVDVQQCNLKILWLVLQVMVLWCLEKIVSPTMSKGAYFGKKTQEIVGVNS
jgi:hypothetical protein